MARIFHGCGFLGLKNVEVRKGLTDGSQMRSEVRESREEIESERERAREREAERERGDIPSFQLSSSMPAEVSALVRQCWSEEPSQRPTMKQIHKQLISLKDTLFANA